MDEREGERVKERKSERTNAAARRQGCFCCLGRVRGINIFFSIQTKYDKKSYGQCRRIMSFTSIVEDLLYTTSVLCLIIMATQLRKNFTQRFEDGKKKDRRLLIAFTTYCLLRYIHG